MESEIGDAVGTTKLDLELELDERPEGHIAGRLIYDRDLFETATVERMAEHWLRVVDAVAADPGASGLDDPDPHARPRSAASSSSGTPPPRSSQRGPSTSSSRPGPLRRRTPGPSRPAR